MSENPRDTQFAGFAKLLLEELMAKYDHLPLGEWGPAEKDKLIIARRAYDLLLHAAYSTAFIATMDVCRERVATVPDLTEWPKEEHDRETR